MKKKLIIVNGTSCTGKTAVCRNLYKKIHRCVWLDGDWCWMMNPWPQTIPEESKRMVEDNITHLLRNFLTHPYFDYVVFCWVIHHEFIFNLILDPLKDLEFELIKVTLTCSEEELRSRICDNDSRSPDETWVQDAIQRLKMYDSMNTIKIDTTNLTVEETANQILKLIGYRG